MPDDQVAEAIRNGICKVNYATELRQAFTRGFMGYMAENPNNFDPKKPSKPGMEEIYKVDSPPTWTTWAPPTRRRRTHSATCGPDGMCPPGRFLYRGMPVPLSYCAAGRPSLSVIERYS